MLPGGRMDLIVRPAAGGPDKTVHLAAAMAPDTVMRLLVLAADTIVGIAFVAAAFLLVWTRPSRMTWGFFLYAIWFNPGQVYSFYAIIQQSPLAVVAQEIGNALAVGAGLAGLLAFALRFPEDTLEPRWRRLDRALPLLALILALLALLTFANTLGFGTETLTRATLLFNYAINAAVLAILLIRRRTLHPLDEQRMRWVIAGAAIGLPAFILAEILQSSNLLDFLWGGSASQSAVGLLYLINGVLGYFVSTAVRRRRVISFAIPLRHGSILTVLTLALAVPIVYLHERLSQYQERLHLPEWIWPFVVAPIALLLLQRVHEAAVKLVDHVFNRFYHRARERLRHAAHSMLGAASPAEIDRLLVDECAVALRLSSAALFRRPGGGQIPCSCGARTRWAGRPTRRLGSRRPRTARRSKASPPAARCASRAGAGSGPACLWTWPLPASPCRSPARASRRARSRSSARTSPAPISAPTKSSCCTRPRPARRRPMQGPRPISCGARSRRSAPGLRNSMQRNRRGDANRLRSMLPAPLPLASAGSGAHRLPRSVTRPPHAALLRLRPSPPRLPRPPRLAGAMARAGAEALL